MITWIQNKFQKHHKWIFGLLLTVIVVAFVLTIGPQSYFGGGGARRIKARDFFGFDLISQKDIDSIFRAAEVSFWINVGIRLRGRDQLDSFGFQRVAYLALADQLGVPEPDEEQFQDYLATKRIFQDTAGNFSPRIFIEFRDRIDIDPDLSQAVVSQVLADDFRIDKVRYTLGGPGHVMPFEAAKELAWDNTQWTIETLTLDYSEVQPHIVPDEAALKEFYESNKFRFKEPEKISITIVDLFFANYTDQVNSPSDEDLETYLENNQNRFPKIRDLLTAGEPVEDVLLLFREKVAQDWKNQKARRLAEEAADEFTVALFRRKIPQYSEEFNALLDTAGATKNRIAPYTQDTPPSDTGVHRKALANAFNLNTKRYFSDVVPTFKGAAVLIYEGKIEERIPPFAEVLAQVQNEYHETNRRKRFAAKGTQLKKIIEASMQEDLSFFEAAENEGFTPISHDPFPTKSPPDELPSALFSQAVLLESGNLSPMILQEDSGTIIYLKAKTDPQYAIDSSEITAKINSLATSLSNRSSNSIIREITNRELAKSAN